jgi:hypothetical protein
MCYLRCDLFMLHLVRNILRRELSLAVVENGVSLLLSSTMSYQSSACNFNWMAGMDLLGQSSGQRKAIRCEIRLCFWRLSNCSHEISGSCCDVTLQSTCCSHKIVPSQLVAKISRRVYSKIGSLFTDDILGQPSLCTFTKVQPPQFSGTHPQQKFCLESTFTLSQDSMSTSANCLSTCVLQRF